MLKSWQKGQQLVLPNPHWPGNKPHFKRVSVKIIESASRRLQNLSRRSGYRRFLPGSAFQP
jgi:ABC-type transport system substrate-binding protein